MQKKSLDINEIRAMHQAGRLEEAREGYLTLLGENPDDVGALHYLGVVYVQEGNLDKAQFCFEEAIKRDQQDPTLQLHLANVFSAKGLWGQAERVLLTMLGSHPEFAAGWNNLGTVYYNQGKWEEAVNAFQSAIGIQSNYVDAYYNLGLAFSKLKSLDDALRAYEALVALSPQHVGGQFQLGCLMMLKKQYKKAIQHFLILHQVHPYHFETVTNLASCYLLLGQLDDAISYYLKALALDANDKQVLFNLGVTHAEKGNLQDSISYYERAVAVDPDFYEAHHNLGAAYLALKKTDQSLAQFHEALRLQPTNEAIQHTVNVLTKQGDLSSSPPAYIRSLFDSYANHYDEHLIHVLRYDVPHLFLQTIEKARVKPTATWDVLDLGCGTGLCGEIIKPLARTLTGIDLSEKMLAVAENKHIYDTLIAMDVLTYLQDKHDQFDLVLAGDVLVYFGDLNAIFSLVYHALKPQGLFIFNLEMSEAEDHRITVSGRFAHHKTYVDQLAATHDFKVLAYRQAALREQQQGPVFGHLYLLEKQ